MISPEARAFINAIINAPDQVEQQRARRTLEAFIEGLEQDQALLDHLQEYGARLNPSNGAGWLVRESMTGRGLRLQQTSREGAREGVRQAIKDSLDKRLAALVGA